MNNCLVKLGIFNLAMIFLFSCATSWKYDRTIYKTRNTKLNILSDPKGNVTVNRNHVGLSPIYYTVSYKEGMDQYKRKVSYWQTDPGKALLVTVLSLGLYLPFSFIPVSPQTELRPSDKYIDNEVLIKVVAEGFTPEEKKVSCYGESTKLIKFRLKHLQVP
ncbi:MAG: hypothetical protein DRP81_06005 [Candidatus Omnitrophota bacterium]|nr:MAG: hypothetical protein DRP81_06005 [Candidatus Omnitrophota bacterium]